MRFAVCVCGDLRGFAHIAWALERRLIGPTTRGGSHVDMFFHVWSDGSRLEQKGVDVMQHLPGVVKMMVEPTSQRLNLTASTYGWGHEHVMDRSGSFESFRSQWRKVHLCFAAALEHGRAHGADYYDAYVRTRADMLHLVEHDLARDHRRMISRAQSLGRGLEYIAMQACLSPWPLAVQDVWAVATPKSAQAFAALPRTDEPNCCEQWVEHRLKSMGIVEPTDGADTTHPVACKRGHSLGALRLRGGAPAEGPVFFLSRMHAIQLGQRCFGAKMRGKKGLGADDLSCKRPSALSDPMAQQLASDVALRPWGKNEGRVVEDPLDRLLRLNETTMASAGRLIRRSACRCARGAAVDEGRLLNEQ